jgi:HSP20 family molecular chaperone IbpA
VGLLKRLFGTEDAMAEARAGEAAAERDEIRGTTTTTRTTMQGERPAGWGEVETSQEGGDLVIALPAPGLDESSIELKPDGSSFQLHAKGSNSQGQHIELNETLKLPEGSDASQARASYEDGRLVVRIPKSALKAKQAG